MPLILSTVANYYVRTFAAPRLGNTFVETKIIHLNRIPVSPEVLENRIIFSQLVDLIIQGGAASMVVEVNMLENLIDACVMECYFNKHMAERDLLFLDDTRALLGNYDSTESEAKQQEFLTNFYKIVNASDHPIRNRLLRLNADSPDLLAVIKNEGRV